MQNALARILLTSALVASAAPANAGEWLDLRVTARLCDDDALAGAGESTPSSPSARFGCAPRHFTDAYDTRSNGFTDTLTLVLHRELGAPDAALRGDVALALVNPLVSAGARDDSSFLRLRWTPRGWAAREGMQLLLFPLSADRMRLGFSQRISFAGGESRGAHPGALARFNRGNFDAFVGTKTALVLDPRLNEEETNYSLLAGAGYERGAIRVDANGGFFERGANPIQSALGEPIRTFGASMQASYRVGSAVPRSIELTLVTEDPTMPRHFFRADEYPGGLSWAVVGEATAVGTTLANPAAKPTTRTVVQPGFAADAQVRVKWNHLRVQLTAMARDLAFVTLEQGSVTPNVALPADLDRSPELFATLSVDRHLPGLRMTPGLALGYQRPSSFTSDKPSDVIGPIVDLGRSTVVVREDPNLSGRILQDILPNSCGASKTGVCTPRAILGARAFTRVHLTEHFAGLAEVYGTYDPNRLHVVDDAHGVSQRRFAEPLSLGFTLALAAGF